MKTKKFLSLLVIGGMIVSGCQVDDPVVDDSGDDVNGGSVDVVLSVTPDSVSLTSEEGSSAEVEFSVTNAVEGAVLSVAYTADWLDVDVDDASASSGTITFTALSETDEIREVVVTVSYEGAESVEVTVTQYADDDSEDDGENDGDEGDEGDEGDDEGDDEPVGTPEISVENASIDAASGDYVINLTVSPYNYNYAFLYAVNYYSASWLTVKSYDYSNITTDGTAAITLTVEANENAGSRTADIMVYLYYGESNQSYNSIEKIVTITQYGSDGTDSGDGGDSGQSEPPVLSVSNEFVSSISADGDTIEITVTVTNPIAGVEPGFTYDTNSNYNPEMFDEATNMSALTSTGDNTATATLTVVVNKNETGSTRRCYVIVTYQGANAQQIYFSQQAS